MLMVVGGKDVGRVLEPVTGGLARVLALSCLLFSLLLIFIPNTSFAATVVDPDFLTSGILVVAE